MPDPFRGDCGRCAALCCVALAFDRGPHFAIDKPADEPCPNLGPAHRCTIHGRLTESGFAGCAAYDCLGAGQFATAMFAGLDTSLPAIRRARADAFARLCRLQALRLALARAGRTPPVLPQTYAALLLVDFAALARLARPLHGESTIPDAVSETLVPPDR